MNIIVMAPDQTFSRVGGLRTQVERTVQEMKNSGICVDYFDPRTEYDFENYDIAHIFSMNLPCYFKAEIVKNRVPLVFSSVMWRTGSLLKIRGLVELGIRSPHLLLNDVIACRKMSEWANLILPNTNAEREWLSRAIGVDKNKCSVVPNGADDNFSDYSDDDLSRLSSLRIDKDFVFCATVISSRKNLKTLGDICFEENLPLVIAGPIVDKSIGDYLSELKRQGADITLLGKLANDSIELGYLYSFCRVFCLPSYYETPGIAALEAGLRGANIVVTRIGGAQDYFEDLALYVNPFDKREMRNNILTAWKKGRSPAKGSILRSKIQSQFSWRAVAAKTITAYETLGR